jgi:shikimate dehydrogenase
VQGPALGLYLSGKVVGREVVTSGPPRRAAVLGRPIGHSLSPVLHRAAYRALGLERWSYDAIDCGADELAALVGGAGPEWAGFSVTMPGKRAAFEVADRRTDGAELVGAANTLLPGPDGWTAANTDVDGIIGALGPMDLSGRDAVLIGAGGTAQAALVAVRQLGARRVHAVVREPARAGALRATAERAALDLIVHTWGTVGAERRLDRAEVLISTVPAHAADPLAGRAWSDRVVLLDAVYAGGPTALARAVTAAGGRAVSGVEMLLHQAAEQVRLMTGYPAPLGPMRAALPPAH